MIATIPSAVLIGVEGQPVHVEVHVSNGLPGFTVVGLPDAAVRESRDRVRAALLSSGLTWPLRRVTVNLAPSGVRKGGAGLDLPIAVGVLVASSALPAQAVEGMAFVGELGLDGSIRGVPGTVVLTEALRGHRLVVAEESVTEAMLASQSDVRMAPTLAILVDRLRGGQAWGHAASRQRSDEPSRRHHPGAPRPPSSIDLADVRGQHFPRRGLEVAAAGGHHLLMVGPPGAGKTMLATCLPGLLPDLDRDTALEATRVHSVSGARLPPGGLVTRPPFRSPHQGASSVAMIGGGTAFMRPGEISLAHGGVLFLDEMGEFPTDVLDGLRLPLEEGEVRVSRARASAVFPARFILVAAMNPCPCGEGGIPGRCRCSPVARERYARRLSAPLLDRFDIAVRVEAPSFSELADERPSESTAQVATRVARVRRRTQGRGVGVNAAIPVSALSKAAPLDAAALRVIERQVCLGSLSARGIHRVQRLARTLADLDDAEDGGSAHGHGNLIGEAHVSEALRLRCQRELLLGEQR